MFRLLTLANLLPTGILPLDHFFVCEKIVYIQNTLTYIVYVSTIHYIHIKLHIENGLHVAEYLSHLSNKTDDI